MRTVCLFSTGKWLSVRVVNLVKLLKLRQPFLGAFLYDLYCHNNELFPWKPQRQIVLCRNHGRNICTSTVPVSSSVQSGSGLYNGYLSLCILFAIFQRLLDAQVFPIIDYGRDSFLFRLKYIPYIASEMHFRKITFDGLFTLTSNRREVDSWLDIGHSTFEYPISNS